MMKTLSKDKVRDVYKSLQKKRKRVKTRSILMAGFVFGVNRNESIYSILYISSNYGKTINEE